MSAASPQTADAPTAPLHGPLHGPLRGRHAVVTGAAQGIGAAIARTLAAQGATLTLMGRRPEALQALADTLPGHAAVVRLDVADEAAVAAAFEAARGRHGPVHILVNNAGQAESAPLARTPLALWQRLLQVNLTGTFLCTQAAMPDLLAAGWGRVVNVASTAGLRGYAYVSAYVAAKHGVVGFTRALALEVARKGVTVNAVCPGYTDTPLLEASLQRIAATTGRSEPEARAELARSNPQGRLVQPDDVAAAVAYLCSEAAASVNGVALPVCGGEVA